MKKTFLLLALTFFITGCAVPIEIYAADIEPAHFGHGLLHGIILPFSFLVSLFNPDVAVYAAHNDGGWYDFGFVIGVTAFLKSAG